MAVDVNAASSMIVPVRRPRVGRVKDLLAGPHGPYEPLFLEAAMRSVEFQTFFDEFLWETISASAGPALAGNPMAMTYATSNVGATVVAKLTPSELDPSSAQLATTAAIYNQSLLWGTQQWTANHFCGMEVRVKVSQSTDFQMTIGFADAIPASAAAVVSNIDTPAVSTVANGAFYAIDTSKTLKTAALVTIGTSTPVAKTVISPTTTPFGIPTAATWFTVRVVLVGNPSGATATPSRAILFVNDFYAAEMAGPDSEKLLLPFFFHGSPGGTALTSQIDYIKVWQQKAGTPY